MTRILLSGACGKMGRMITELAESNPDVEIICGVDMAQGYQKFPIYSSFDNINEKPDVIIDFSSVTVLEPLLRYAKANAIPAVLATTGYSEAQIAEIKEAAKVIPVFFTANMSLGVNLLCALSKRAAEILGNGFDVEIIEKHHNLKIDAPSGTALMLANAINDVSNDKYHYEYDRHSKRQKRAENEIGIHAVRGGTIVGEHDVIFAGNDEVITLSHSAASKGVFANGSLKAAVFLKGRSAGLYDMNSILNIE